MSGSVQTVTVLIPNFNDWESVGLLLARLDPVLERSGRRAAVLVVDDASAQPLPADWLPGHAFAAIPAVDVLHLRCTLGHQRAIALGLYHVHEFTTADLVVI